MAVKSMSTALRKMLAKQSKGAHGGRTLKSLGLLLMSMASCVCAFAQATGPATAQGTCNAPNTGNNSTVTITCYGVDKKLAEQIGQLVAASKRDAKTL